MLKNLSPENGYRALVRFGVTLVIMLTLALSVSAYTLVFRNGQRMEIPAEFTLTNTTLTYEISPGFNRTLQLILIDVAATERANHEAPGGFFKHKEEIESQVDSQPLSPATRTLTNSDLALVRQRRIESEQSYDKRRKELGLPSVEETRKRQDEESAVLRDEIRERNAAHAREESYWRNRARELRTEIAMVDNQINYVRGRLNDVNESAAQNRPWVTGVYGWPGDGGWGYGRYPNPSRPGRVARPGIILGSPNIYGYPNGNYPNGYPGGNWPYGYPGGNWPYGYPGGTWPYGYPNGINNNYDYSTERANLTNRMDDLLQKRSALAVQWRQLEDDARDARIPQIWLEP